MADSHQPYHILKNGPAIQKLTIHLPDQQNVFFPNTDNLENVMNRYNINATMFTKWMETNQEFPEAAELTYEQFPTYFVWNSSQKVWKRRQQCSTIGRIVHLHPTAGEIYYLRMLLNIVKGPKSYEEIRTVGKVILPTFREACYMRGLLEDDKEWFEVMEQSSHWASPRQLRHLFVMLLLHCQIENPRKLWDKCWKKLAEDIPYIQRKPFSFTKMHFREKELESYALIQIERILLKNNKSLIDFEDLPRPDPNFKPEMLCYI